MSGNTVGGGGFLGGWRALLVLLGAAAVIGLIVLAVVLLGRSTTSRVPAPRPTFGPGTAGAEWRPPAAPRDQAVQPVASAAPPPVTASQPVGPVRRPRASSMAAYDNPEPVRATPRPAAPAAAAPPEETRIAGMAVQRAQILPDPAWWLMPGDKIPCENLEPITARTGADFSATVPVDVMGRTGTQTLVPRFSRVKGHVVRGLQNGQERLAAILTSIETPSVPGRPTIVVPLAAPAADVLGQVDLEGNVETHFWSRLGAVAAYAGLDALSTAGGVLAGQALSDAISGASGGRGGVGIYSFNGIGRSLAGSEYGHQINRPPSFERPQGQACTVFVNQPIDFRIMRTAAR